MQLVSDLSPATPSASSVASPLSTDHERFKTLYDLRQRNLKELNQNVSLDSNLDANMKKNLTFVKKLKLINSDNIASILSDLNKLKLEKYIAEIITSILENFASPTRKLVFTDLDSILQCVSAFHLRFQRQFTPLLIEAAMNACALKPSSSTSSSHTSSSSGNNSTASSSSASSLEKEEKDRILKGKGLIRFITDMYLTGLFHPIPHRPSSTTSSHQALSNTPTTLISNTSSSSPSPNPDHFLEESSPSKHSEKSSPTKVAQHLYTKFYRQLLHPSHINLPLLSVVLRFYHPLFFSDSGLSLLFNDALLSLYEPTQTYFQKHLIPSLLSYHEKNLRLGHKTHEWYFERGYAAPEDLKSNADMAQKQFEHLLSLSKSISGYMKWEVPSFTESHSLTHANGSMMSPSDSTNDSAEITLHIMDKSSNSISSFFEDEDQRQFYEDLPRISSSFPPSSSSNEHVADEETIPTATTTTTSNSSTSTTNTLSALLTKLPQSNSIALIDQWALDFSCMATKSSHTKLVKILMDFRSRPDILPFYARLLAILKEANVFPLFLEEFEDLIRRQIHSTNYNLRYETRLTSIRYLCELVKFQLIPDHVLFFVLKSLLDHFSPINVELFCAFIEECGRLLYLLPRTQPRLLELLERASKLKKKLTDSRLEILVESALLSITPQYVSPPKERSNEELYLMYLLSSLDMNSVKSVAQKLCKFQWQSTDTVAFIHTRLTKLKYFKFHQLEALACVVYIVASYHPEVGVHVVDTILEQIQVGLEKNHFRDNQLRIMQIVFLAHLFNVLWINEDLMIKTLEYLLAFPYKDGPNQFFRIRLVVSALNACWKRLNKDRLDRFLIIFQFFIANKNALPIDLEFAVDDLFEVMRPDSHRLSLEEAYQAIKGLITFPLPPAPPPQPSKPTSPPNSSISNEIESEEDFIRDMDQALQELQMEPSKTRRKATSNFIEVPNAHNDVFSKVPKNKTTVSVLTRKNNKPVTKLLKIEEQSKLGQHMQRVVHEAKLEHQQLKQFVLNYDKQERKEALASQTSVGATSGVGSLARQRRVNGLNFNF